MSRTLEYTGHITCVLPGNIYCVDIQPDSNSDARNNECTD